MNAAFKTTTSHLTEQDENNRLSGYAPVNGLRMYYEICGAGEALVLIHGGGSTINTTFGNILPLLAAHFKVIAVELQAHGHTNDRGVASTFEQDADDVAALAEHLQIDKAHFFGFSNGGNTAMQIAIRHPDLVNKLIIVSSFYKREGMISGFFEGMKHASLNNMPKPLQEAFLQITGSQEGLQIMHGRDKERMIQFIDWSDDNLKSIKAPALIVAGDQDVVTVEHTVEIAQTIPNAQLMILPGTHGSFIGEICSVKQGSKMPGMFVEVIEEFLNN